MRPGSESGLQVQGLRKKVADFELRADFALAHVDRAVLLGPSGSGKSTLLRVLAGLEKMDPPLGSIRLGGEEVSRQSPALRQIGFVFQDQALFPEMSVLDNAAFGLKVRGVPRAEREEAAEQWLARAGLSARLRFSARNLSGGERQRLALVRALVWKPRLLLLDEPFSALDLRTRQEFSSVLIDLQAQAPIPWIIVSHDPQDAQKLATVRLGFSGTERLPVRCVSREI